MWPKIWGLIFDIKKFGLAFVKTTDTKAMCISDDLKRENIQKTETLSKKAERLKIAVFKGHLPVSSTLK